MKHRILLVTTLVCLLLPATAVAAPLRDEGQTYTVKAGDWLSKIAGEFLGDICAYPAIVQATNAKASSDDSYDLIFDPNKIEVGQKLWIPGQDTSEDELSLMDLMNSTYQYIYDEPVQLKNGLYEGAPFVEGGASRPTVTLTNYGFGDLNEDGIEDAAVILVENSGGSGNFRYLAAVVSQDDGFANVTTMLLGDRWQVRSVSVDDGEITLDTLTHGPDDPLCCPSLEMTFVYALQGNMLREVAPHAQGIYKGFLPAATCCGQDITLFLNANNSARRQTDYLNGQAPILEDGMWEYGQGGSVVLTLTGRPGTLYNEADVITYEITDLGLAPVEWDETRYGSNGPAGLQQFELLGWEGLEPPYSVEAATEMVENSGFVGIYKAFLPAATCCGQDITLSLSYDGKGQMRTDYLDGETVLVQVGTWEAHDLDGLTLTITGEKNRTYEQPQIIELVWEDGRLSIPEEELSAGAWGMTLFHLNAIIAAVMGE